MQVRAIVNPRAGVRSRHAFEALAGTPAGWRLEIETTDGPGHARDLAHEAAERGDDMVLAVGGDGTINEVGTGLLGSRTALGVVPAGSGNGLARTLGITLDPHQALRELASGVRRRMDVGRINGQPFLNVAGIGFDAYVAAAFHRWGKPGRRRGVLPYAWLAVGAAMSFKPSRWRLETPGESVEQGALLATFANGRQWGGGAIIAPRAKLDDGLLEIIVIEPCSVFRLSLNTPRLFRGTLDHFAHYRCWTAPSATMSGPDAVDHHRDGEPGQICQRFEVTLEPRALDVIVPRTTAADPRGPFMQAAADETRSE